MSHRAPRFLCPTAAFLLATLVAMPLAASADAPASPPASVVTLVQTRSGPAQGHPVADGRVLAWLGLPYAEPPVGERRWQAPQPHAPWSEVQAADRFGAPCVQIGGPYGPPPAGESWGKANLEVFGKAVGSEDCLTLNVWRPAQPGRPRPVLVFVHGGSNVAGYSGDPTYDGARLAAGADAVVVTINYRLGLFGWFTHPSLHGGDPLSNSGNFGTLDIIAALRFVHDNAAAFGGDPGNVTLMGQSAGTINIYSLMVSPPAAGLFHKAILLSGLIGDTVAPDKGYAYAETFAARLMVEDGVAGNEALARQKLAGDPLWLGRYLKDKSAAQIVESSLRIAELKKGPGGAFGDGVVLPPAAAAAFGQGKFAHMPALIGATRDEAKLFPSTLKLGSAERFRMMIDSKPDGEPLAKPADLISGYMLPFLSAWPYDTYNALITTVLMHGVNKSIATLARDEPRTFVYRFDWNRAPEPWKTVYGASHGIDLPFIFGNFSNGFFAMDFSQQNRPGREALSRLMMQSIGAFLRSGDPNAADLPVRWNAWRDDSRSRLLLDASDRQASVRLDP
ncbi:MAG: carboxylesterase/lipase family protein [Solimonas sp.]